MRFVTMLDEAFFENLHNFLGATCSGRGRSVGRRAGPGGGPELIPDGLLGRSQFPDLLDNALKTSGDLRETLDGYIEVLVGKSQGIIQ